MSGDNPLRSGVGSQEVVELHVEGTPVEVSSRPPSHKLIWGEVTGSSEAFVDDEATTSTGCQHHTSSATRSSFMVHASSPR